MPETAAAASQAVARWVRTATQPALRGSTILGLHKRMFDRTWEWAGRYRTSDKNIGILWAEIGVEIRTFIDEGAYWLEKRFRALRQELIPYAEAAGVFTDEDVFRAVR